MTRNNNKRHGKYEIVGLRFSNGKKTIEVGRAYNRKEVGLYMAKDDVWEQVEQIFDALVTVKETMLDNGHESISVHVEDVRFQKVVEEQPEDQDNGIILQ